MYYNTEVYDWDLTRVLSRKLVRQICSGETVVDLWHRLLRSVILNSVAALQFNVERHGGITANLLLPPVLVADRVNLGLLRMSEKVWPLAVQILVKEYRKHWDVACEHVQRVKSYTPKVYHLVAAIHCVSISTA
ncbi:TRNA wybutosine-synthesizing protein [Phytophthora megakarya]|uniref:tRNA wybutosine-synthesizing protein n=1 Tax=Phytophthora megakarya TaxID=4795 RepID=A0A225VGB7_9STRA|nr:TRNA wybutosine-synthesizing protein [Phytophthora megakarya]